MAGFKASTTRRINNLQATPGKATWQRNDNEHIIRNDDDLARIREYILDNPLRWDLDEENPRRGDHRAEVIPEDYSREKWDRCIMGDGVRIDSGSVGEEGSFLSQAELERRLAALPPAPSGHGRIALVVRSGQGGVREAPGRVVVTPEGGVPGHAWGRSPDPTPESQLAVMQADVARLIANGQPLPLFGDNLFLDLDLSTANLPPGSRVRAGAAILEVTPTPHNGCLKFRSRFGDAALRFVSRRDLRARNLRGIYMRVIEAGEIGPGDSVEVLSRAPLPEGAGPSQDGR